MLKKLMLLIIVLLMLTILLFVGYFALFFKPKEKLDEIVNYLNKNYNINLTLNDIEYSFFPKPSLIVGKIIIKDEKQSNVMDVESLKIDFNLFNNISFSASDVNVGEIFDSNRFNSILITGLIYYGKVNNPVTKFITNNQLNVSINNFSVNNVDLLKNWKTSTNFNSVNSVSFLSLGLFNSLPFNTKGDIKIQDKVAKLSMKGNYDVNMKNILNEYFVNNKLEGNAKVDFYLNSESSNNLMSFIQNMKGSFDFSSSKILFNNDKYDNTLVGNIFNPFFETFDYNKIDINNFNFSVSIIDYKMNRYVFAGEFSSNNTISNSVVNAMVEGYIEGNKLFSKQYMILENLNSNSKEEISSWIIDDSITHSKNN